MMLFGKKNKEKKLAKLSKKSDLNDKIISNSVLSRPILGVPLSVAIKNSRSHDGIPVPALVRQCIDYIEKNGLEMEGIYRVSAPISRLDELEKQANSGGKIEFVDPHDAAGLLKRFLRQLPDHLLSFSPLGPSSFENVANSCQCKSDIACTCETVEHLKEMLKRAPKENFYLIAYVFLHARHVVDKQKHNKMTLGALGVLLQAMLSVTKNIIRIFILNAIPDTKSDGSRKTVFLFDGIPFKRYVKPLTITEISTHSPQISDEIMEEITKQQNFLEEINDQVMLLRKENCDTKQKEQEMWDVQQGITILKRKLKMVSQDMKEDQSLKTTESEIGNICEPGPKLEKHLLAVQCQLIEDIIEEQKQIVELSARLEELQADLLLHEEQNGLSNREKTPLATRPKLPPPPPPPISDLNELAKAIPTNGFLEETGQGCDECHRQESRHQILVDQIAKMRDECAQYRAKLEDSREMQKTITIDAADDFGTASVVVTKF